MHRRRSRTGRGRRAASTLLLLAGYPLAAWGTARLKAAWRHGDATPVVAFEAGTVAVTLGLAVRRKPVVATLNGLAAAGVAAAWLTRRRRPR